MENHALAGWLNEKHISESGRNKMKATFTKATPFPHLEIKDFLKENKAKTLLLALAKERFILKEADLFKFKHTNDITSSSVKELKDFRGFLLCEEFLSYMESITGLTLKRGAMDLAASLYEDTDYLLPHDDQLEGRKIAFLLYLSTMGKSVGGALGLLDKKLKTVKRIVPQFNTFAFFEVSPHSYHEVEEVLKDKQRITLGGWFHGK